MQQEAAELEEYNKQLNYYFTIRRIGKGVGYPTDSGYPQR
jgi:hypothetical protein